MVAPTPFVWRDPATIPQRSPEERAKYDPTSPGFYALDLDLSEEFTREMFGIHRNAWPDGYRRDELLVRPADWQGLSVPEREWLVDDLIPSGTVTLLSGDGGVGKSLLALQIGVAVALGVDTVGLSPSPGRCLYLGAEDDCAEFHRRLAAIVAHHGRKLADLGDDFALIPLAGLDAVLSLPDRQGQMAPTALWSDVEAIAREREPNLVVLDTSADLFGGDEIKRTQVRQFVSMLRGLAIEIGCAVLLLSHPSVAGMVTGTGTSGSTAWSNSVRSRLYMERVLADKKETGTVSLSTKKSNYGPSGAAKQIRWQDGVFVAEVDVSPLVRKAVDRGVDDTFLSLLEIIAGSGQTLSPNPSQSHAPRVMADHPDANGISKKQFAAAMQRLLKDGRVAIIEEGPPSRRYKRLVMAGVEDAVGSGSN